MNVNRWLRLPLCDSDSVMTGSRFSADLQSGGRIAPRRGEGWRDDGGGGSVRVTGPIRSRQLSGPMSIRAEGEQRRMMGQRTDLTETETVEEKNIFNTVQLQPTEEMSSLEQNLSSDYKTNSRSIEYQTSCRLQPETDDSPRLHHVITSGDVCGNQQRSDCYYPLLVKTSS